MAGPPSPPLPPPATVVIVEFGPTAALVPVAKSTPSPLYEAVIACEPGETSESTSVALPPKAAAWWAARRHRRKR